MDGVSGSELFLLQFMPELKRRGYSVELLLFFPKTSTKNADFVAQLQSSDIVVHEIYGHRTLSPILIWKVFRLIKKRKVDLFQSNLIHADLLSAVIKFLFVRKLKILSIKHGYHPRYQAKYGFDLRYVKFDVFYWIEKFACIFIDFNIAISTGLTQAFAGTGIVPSHKIRTIPYGLSLTLAKSEVSFNKPDFKYVVILGRLIAMKGHSYLLKSWTTIKKVEPNLHLLIIGDGSIRSKLETFVVKNKLDDVIHFLGHQSNPHPWLENSLFTIVTSTWEGFGFIILESWHHKKPVIAFDVPAMNEIIAHEETGLLVPFSDTNRLTAEILRLIENPKQIALFGENGFQRLTEYYTLNRMSDEICSVIEDLRS